MITLLKFFSLVFCVQKNYNQIAPLLLASDNNRENERDGTIKGSSNLFNVEWLLEGLCSKNSFIFLDCLCSLKSIDIEKYNSLNTSNYLHIYYLKNEIKTLTDYQRLSNFAKELNKSTFYQIINSCKNIELKNKLIYLENKINLKSLKKRTKLQSFFQYINTTFQEPKDLEYERESIAYEIKRFFSNSENKISLSSEVNQAQSYNLNYFGAFIKNLLSSNLPAKTLLQMLAPIFKSEKNLIYFLSSLSLAEDNVTIFNNISDEDKRLLQPQFNQLKTKSIANVFFGNNYNFIYSPEINSSNNTGHALYLFDSPLVFSLFILKSSNPELAGKSLIQYLDSIKNNLNPKFEEKLASFEAAALSYTIKFATNGTTVSKI